MEYVFIKERHLARIENDETLFYGTDHINSTVLMTNQAGEVVWTGDASPFGDYRVIDSDSYEEIGLKFSGKDYDLEADLYYFNARWYDPTTGRFLTEDPVKDGLLWFAYCSNNPLKFVDPTGLAKEDRLERRAKRRENRAKAAEENGNSDRATRLRQEAVDLKTESDRVIEERETAEERELLQLTFGVRGSVIIGGELEAGLIINPNDPLDSGLLLSGGLGYGLELAVDTPLLKGADNLIGVISGTYDPTKPTHSSDLEGVSDKIVVGAALAGAEFDLEGGLLGTPGDFSGLETLNVGVGAYRNATTVITAEEVIEATINVFFAPIPFIPTVDVGRKNQ